MVIMQTMQCVFVVLNVLRNLSAIFYMIIFILKIFRKMFVRLCSVVCLVCQKNMLAFALPLSFMFGVYVGHCILSFYCGKKSKK